MSDAKRKKLWIDAPLQLRMVGFILILLASALVLTYLSMDRGLEQAALQSERAFVPVDWARDAMVVPFYVSTAIVLLTGSVMAILWSHRFVGPLMVLTAGMRRIRDGDLSGDEKPRSSDTLGGILEDFCKMRDELRQKLTEDRRMLEHLDSRMTELSDKKLQENKFVDELRHIRDELRNLRSTFQL